MQEIIVLTGHSMQAEHTLSTLCRVNRACRVFVDVFECINWLKLNDELEMHGAVVVVEHFNALELKEWLVLMHKCLNEFKTDCKPVVVFSGEENRTVLQGLLPESVRREVSIISSSSLYEHLVMLLKRLGR